MFTSSKPALAFNAVTLDEDVTVVVSGLYLSVQRICGGLHNPGHDIYHFEMDLAAKCKGNLGNRSEDYDDFRLAPVVFADEQCRGGTDAKLLFCFDRSLSSSIVPELESDVQHILRYYIDSGVKGRFPMTSSDEVPTIIAPPYAPFFQDGMMQGGGLFCMLAPSGE